MEGVGLTYAAGGRAVEALRGVDFSVAAGEFVCLLGPSGCGKSTILHVAAGFLAPTAGRVLADGRPIEGPGPDRGVVFQQHNLFPWLTIAGNVGFGPRMKGLSRAAREAAVERALGEVKLAEFAAHYPNELSMGMQQRVGLARAFANEPEILLMDEPFASLDALTRLQMQRLLLQLWEKHRRTVLFVTHDVDEALLLSDRILVLDSRPGRVARELAVELGPRAGRARDPRLPAVKEDILAGLAA